MKIWTVSDWKNSSSSLAKAQIFSTPEASVHYVDKHGEEQDIEFCGKTDEDIFTLEEKRAELRRLRQQGEDLKGLYIKELRYIDKYKHAVDDEYCKTVLKRDLKDWVGVDKSRIPIYWDRYSEGVFVGNCMSGSSLHVDQVLWSNVGKNWSGYKIFASWAFDDKETYQFLSKNYGKLFTPPISDAARAALAKACKLCIVGPGDVFAFSGANPHMTICVGEELSVTAYESFVNVQPKNVQVFCSTNTEAHYERSHMQEDDLRDLKHDVVDLIEDHFDRWYPNTRKRSRSSSSSRSSSTDTDSDSASVSKEKKMKLQHDESENKVQVEEKKEPSLASQQMSDSDSSNKTESADHEKDKKTRGSASWQSWIATHDSFLASHRSAHEERKAIQAWTSCIRLLRKHDPFFERYVNEDEIDEHSIPAEFESDPGMEPERLHQ